MKLLRNIIKKLARSLISVNGKTIYVNTEKLTFHHYIIFIKILSSLNMLSNNYIIKSFISNTINTRQKYHIHWQNKHILCVWIVKIFLYILFFPSSKINVFKKSLPTTLLLDIALFIELFLFNITCCNLLINFSIISLVSMMRYLHESELNAFVLKTSLRKSEKALIFTDTFYSLQSKRI